jgi:glycosyltransferase involved in cell wall biosynthesis
LEGVELLPLTWDRAAIAALYQQANVFILPSRQETWGDVLLEAMAFGVPCIGVTGQAMEEIVRPDQTGLLVQPENVDALSRALTQLLVQPDLRRKMGEAAHKLVLDEYTWARVAERLEVVAQKIVTC